MGRGKTVRVWGWLSAVLAWPTAGSDWTPQEIAAMPPYCAARMNRDANYPEYKRWEDT